jgi:hypothetical protein
MFSLTHGLNSYILHRRDSPSEVWQHSVAQMYMLTSIKEDNRKTLSCFGEEKQTTVKILMLTFWVTAQCELVGSPEDGGRILLRNAYIYLQDNTALRHRMPTSDTLRIESKERKTLGGRSREGLCEWSIVTKLLNGHTFGADKFSQREYKCNAELELRKATESVFKGDRHISRLLQPAGFCDLSLPLWPQSALHRGDRSLQ